MGETMGKKCVLGGTTFGPIEIDELPKGQAEPQGGMTRHLEVPLTTRRSLDLNLYDGGVLAEKDRYSLSLRVETDVDVTSVKFCVNDSEELDTVRSELLPLPDGTKVLSFVCDYRDSDIPDEAAYIHPFGLGTGFSRIEVMAEFADGRERQLCSQDVVTLSGTLKGNSEDERILDELLHSSNNQAAEWMFSQPGDTAPDGRELSADTSTDWADDSLESCAQAIASSLDLVSDGVRRADDGFPNTAGGSFDTAENRVVRAFLVSLSERAKVLEGELADEETRARDLLARIDVLVRLGDRRYSSGVHLPARTVFEARADHVHARMMALDELGQQAAAVLRSFDACAPGVSHVAYRAPKNFGAFLSNQAYRTLRSAMRSWRQFEHVDYVREHRALHVLKPDRLYEYYCLYRLLDALHGLGFSERVCLEGPAVDYFHYSAEENTDFYDNEERCANTYRLVRRLDDGAFQEVDLYFVPVLYAGALDENGISLRKLRENGSSYSSTATAMWTPDFLLVARTDGRPTQTTVMDAKHFDLEQALSGLVYKGQKNLYERVRNHYIERVGGGSERMPLPKAVWLLCAYGDQPEWLDQRGGGLMWLGPDTPDDAVRRLLARCGVE